MWTSYQLERVFSEAGLAADDVVLAHSALRRLGPVDGGADTVIDALLSVVGPEGTVAVPTHTWATVGRNQPVFHETLSPSGVGALTDVFRQRPEAVRSLHPTHSIAAIGVRARSLVEGHERDDTPCSPVSPYGRIAEWKGKVLLIGKGLECCTFFHCVEEIGGCGSWSLSEHRELFYTIAADARVIEVPSRCHRNSVSDNYPRLEGYLLSEGILKLTQLGDCPLYCLDAQASAEWLAARLRKNTKFLWS